MRVAAAVTRVLNQEVRPIVTRTDRVLATKRRQDAERDQAGNDSAHTTSSAGGTCAAGDGPVHARYMTTPERTSHAFVSGVTNRTGFAPNASLPLPARCATMSRFGAAHGRARHAHVLQRQS